MLDTRVTLGRVPDAPESGERMSEPRGESAGAASIEGESLARGECRAKSPHGYLCERPAGHEASDDDGHETAYDSWPADKPPPPDVKAPIGRGIPKIGRAVFRHPEGCPCMPCRGPSLRLTETGVPSDTPKLCYPADTMGGTGGLT